MRIILADDHELVRAGFRPFLAELAPNVEVVEAEQFSDALGAAEHQPPALAILDLRMPGMDMEALGNFRQKLPNVPVVILSASVETEDVVRCLQAGVSGYIPKTFGGPATLAALRVVMTGERFFPSFAIEALAEGGHGIRRGGLEGMSRKPAENGTLLDKLSARECDILGLMIEGGTNKEIARRLEVQEITVKVHLRNIYRKLGAANRAQAVRIALENGWQQRQYS